MFAEAFDNILKSYLGRSIPVVDIMGFKIVAKGELDARLKMAAVASDIVWNVWKGSIAERELLLKQQQLALEREKMQRAYEVEMEKIKTNRYIAELQASTQQNVADIQGWWGAQRQKIASSTQLAIAGMNYNLQMEKLEWEKQKYDEEKEAWGEVLSSLVED